jgi:thiamine transport system permease protein
VTVRAGQITAILVAGLVAAGLVPVLWLALTAGFSGLDAHVMRVVGFTLGQAILSTLISAGIGVAAGLALARRRFSGRLLLLRLLNLPLALPALVVVLGLLSIFGAEGPLAGVIPLYGLGGILLAHGFYNAPLVARYTLSALGSIPGEQLRLAAQLGLSDHMHLRLVDWPALKRMLPGTLMLVFLLCAASFTIVLTLGGGPRATTLEVAIYQSLRADFDVARAALLACIQIAFFAVLGAAALGLRGMTTNEPSLDLLQRRHDGTSPAFRLLDGLSLLLLLLLLLPPLAALVIAGLDSLAVTPLLVHATMLSLVLAAASALVAVTAAWPLARAAARGGLSPATGRVASLMGLIAPPAVIATGWTLLAIHGPGLRPVSVSLVILLNALMALPFAYGVLGPAWSAIGTRHDRLCASLGLAGWNRLRWIDLPALRRPLALALAMAGVLSLGDLSAVLFFGEGRVVTLPALIYQQMGSYRMSGAMGTALILACLSLALLWIPRLLEERDA